jgi:diguanylate cyclase
MLATLRLCLSDADPARGQAPDHALVQAQRAAEIATALGRPLDAALAQAWSCTHLLRLGRHAQALQAAATVRPQLAVPELLAARHELLRTLTLAGSESGDFALALDAAQEAQRLSALDGGGTALQATMLMAIVFERMGDYWHALRLLTAGLERGTAHEPPHAVVAAYNGLCVTCIGILHRLLGSGADEECRDVLSRARVAGERAREVLRTTPHPLYETAVLGNLAEVMLYQGELDEADHLLQQAHALAVQRGLGAYTWRLQASRGSWMLAMGRPEEALQAMGELLQDMGQAPPPQTDIRARHVAYRACRELGRDREALVYFEQVERAERLRSMAQLRAQSQLFVTRTEAQHAVWQAEQARQDAQHHRQRAAEFAASAERDPLTSLGNRRHFDRRCAELLPSAAAEQRPLALALVDIDHFKAVNDELGHAAGDEVLQEMARLLRDNTRARDVLARHGGEEFVIVLPGMTRDAAVEVCERLRDRVATHAWPGAGLQGRRVTISVGLAAAPPYDVAVLLQSADEALYRAKRGGRNRVERAAG